MTNKRNFLTSCLHWIWNGVINWVAEMLDINIKALKAIVFLLFSGWCSYVVVNYVAHLPTFDKARAESRAVEFFTEHNIKIKSIVCNKDTIDKHGYKDGWSSCTFTKENSEKLLTIQCDTAIIFATSCKVKNLRTISYQ